MNSFEIVGKDIYSRSSLYFGVLREIFHTHLVSRLDHDKNGNLKTGQFEYIL